MQEIERKNVMQKCGKFNKLPERKARQGEKGDKGKERKGETRKVKENRTIEPNEKKAANENGKE